MVLFNTNGVLGWPGGGGRNSNHMPASCVADWVDDLIIARPRIARPKTGQSIFTSIAVPWQAQSASAAANAASGVARPMDSRLGRRDVLV